MVDPQSYANGGPPPGGVVQASQGPSNKIQIFISCRKLKDLDILSKSDPVCVMFLKDSKSNSWQRLGETEMMLNNLNPDFTKSFTIDYYFEKQQDIKFELYDVDPNGREHIGDYTATVSKLMGANRQTLMGELQMPGH